MKLSQLGFDKWFKDKTAEAAEPELKLARVSAVDKDNCLVTGEKGEMQAQIIGRMRFDAETNLDYPCVGDWVYVKYFNENTLAIIHGILPRKTLLKRKAAGKKIEFQPIAANIDTACIMQSLDENFSIPRLDRYMVAINQAGIATAVFLSKSDLVSPKERQKKVSEIKARYPKCHINVFSNISKQGLEEVRSLFVPAKTYCFIGSSGVGKTTLLNRLLGRDAFATKAVRQWDHKGKHATTRRQLIMLKGGALYIDTPGMREWGNIGVDSGIKETFPDVEKLAEKCRFKDCTHTNEPECAIKQALESGELLPGRLKSYIKLRRESEYHARSYVEKRRKDREFGKMVRSVMNQKKKKMGSGLES